MRKIVVLIMAMLFFTPPAMAGGGLEGFLNQVNVQAHGDMNGFFAKVSAQFGVPEAQIRVVLGKVPSPADAFMIFQLGAWTRQDHQAVMRTYESRKGHGWGAVAKELGIKPGSAEFHALKQGDLRYGPNPGTPGNSGKSKGKGKGKNKD
jgi:hypothetical protein